MGFKPIFEDERLFFKENTGINLPSECWRSGSKIYLDFTQPKPFIQFKVENKKILITKDNRNGYKEKSKTIPLPKQLSIKELIKLNSKHLDELYDQSLSELLKCIGNFPNHYFILSHSGGKDSTLLYYIWQQALRETKQEVPEWIINFANTSNDVAETYKFIKQLPKDKLNILNPKIGWRKWITDVKNYYIPSTRVRSCCSEYKEGQINKAYDNNRDTIHMIGVRKYESIKRSEYDIYMDSKWRDMHFNVNNVPEKWINFAPIVNWKDEDVWMFLLRENIQFNPLYKLGFHRVGCLICPFQQDYIDLIIAKHFPLQWEWWNNVLEKNYEITCVEKNLKWTLDEWKNGRWKRALGKINEIIRCSPTKQRVEQVSAIMGISDNMARKYFNSTCLCGKRLNPTEIAMYYKTYGRYENAVNDTRECLCKKCYCNENNMSAKEYQNKVKQFRDIQNCALF